MKKLILLIEDDLATIDVYQTAFKVDNLELEVITWGGDAIERIKAVKEGKAKKPDIILLNLFLPDISGLGILEEIRKHEETKDIPVFILTSYTIRQLARLGYDFKPEKHINKFNYPPTRLVKLIKDRLGEK